MIIKSFVLDVDPTQTLLTPPQNSKSWKIHWSEHTLGGVGVSTEILCRCLSAQEYKEFFGAAMVAVDAEMNELSASETRWIEHWRSNVDKVKALY